MFGVAFVQALMGRCYLEHYLASMEQHKLFSSMARYGQKECLLVTSAQIDSQVDGASSQLKAFVRWQMNGFP